MEASGVKGRCGRALRYLFGGLVCSLTVAALWAGLRWYWAVVLFCLATLLILGRRRIFRAGVTRTSGEIVCRYVPWFEGNAYFLNVALPLMAVASVAAGYTPGNPVWLRFVGIVLLGVTPLGTFAAVRMWRRCSLRISPSALTVRLAAHKDGSIEIRRERLEAITPKMIANSVNGVPSLQVEIAYRPAGLDGTATDIVLLGLQLTVEPINLLNALVAWKDSPYEAPDELMDRIERILRGHSTVTA
jgi:hypothetical protein